MKHFIYIPFTGLGLSNGFLGQEWYDNRADIFRDTTLKSLKNQNNKNFILWVSFREQEMNNPITKRIEEYIKETGLKYILTFDGIMMHDDRGVEHNVDLKERMARSLNKLEALCEGCDWIFKTDCGSDDMFSEEAIDEIQKEIPRERGATYYLNGYIFNKETGQLACWNRNTSCSKYTVMYPKEIFIDAEKHLKYIEGLVSHEYLPLVFDATKLPDGRYCCTVHGYNISTGWNNTFRGDEIFRKEKKDILSKFGICLDG